MLIAKVNQFFHKNKKIFFYIGIFLIISYLFSDFCSAGLFETTAAEKEKEIIKSISVVVKGILEGASLLLALSTYLATVFLTPEWINGTAFGLEVKFKAIWILISNVVYFIFAFVLIWIAFMNIIGKNNDQYQLKQALPKFIVGVLIVPFSWFFVQFLLSISSILTIGALTLPYDGFAKDSEFYTKDVIPRHCIIDFTHISEGVGSDKFFSCPGGKSSLKSALDSDKSQVSIFGLIATYTYGILNVEYLDTLKEKEYGKITVLSDLIIKIAFDVLFIVVYLILMITLAIVLVVRSIYIWIFTMISPLFGLMYFFDKGDSGGFEKFSLKQFVALALVPVYTMLALSFGMLFISEIGGELITGKGPIKLTSSGDKDGISIGDDLYKLEIKGAPGTEDKGGVATAMGGAKGVIGNLILKIFGIIVLWTAVIAALKSSKITEEVAQPMIKFGENVGNIAKQLPGNIPVFPGGQSMSSLSTAASTVGSHITSEQQKKGGEFGRKFIGMSETDKKYQDLGHNPGGSREAALKNIKDIIAYKGIDTFKDSTYAIEALVKQLENLQEEGGFKEDVSGLIHQLKTQGIGNETIITDVLSQLDERAINSKLSIVDDKVGTKNDIRDIFGTKQDDSGSEQKINTSDKTIDALKAKEAGGTPDVDIKISRMDTKINTKGGVERLDAKELEEISGQIINQNLEGIFTREQFKSKLRGDYGITDKEAEKIAKGVETELRKVNKNPETFFKSKNDAPTTENSTSGESIGGFSIGGDGGGDD